MKKQIRYIILLLFLTLVQNTFCNHLQRDEDHQVSEHSKRSNFILPQKSIYERIDNEQNLLTGSISNESKPGVNINPSTNTSLVTNLTNNEYLDNAGLNNTNSSYTTRGGRFLSGWSRANTKRRNGGYTKRGNNGDLPSYDEPTNIVSATLNLLNPIPYFRESLKSIRSTLVRNVINIKKPFNSLSRPSKFDNFPHESHNIFSETNRHSFRPEPPILPPLLHTPETSTNRVKTDSNTTPDTPERKESGLNLRIPPQYSNYSTLQLEMKPNGEFDVVPVTTKHVIKLVIDNENKKTNSKHDFNHFNSFDLAGSERQVQNVSVGNLKYTNPNSPFIIKLIPNLQYSTNSPHNILLNEFKDSHSNIYPNFIPKIDSNQKLQFVNGPSKNHQKYIARPNSSHNRRPVYNSLNRHKKQINPSNFVNHSKRRHKYKPIVKNNPQQIYHIDITIPDNMGKKPNVQHYYSSSMKNRRRLPLRRNKRNAKAVSKKLKELRERRSKYLEFNGWRPLNSADPMSDEPTLEYKPPTLAKVKFKSEETKEKSLYPIVPVNKPVYVVRATPSVKEVDSVYGTEKLNYLHIDPETNSTKVFSSHNKNEKASSNPIIDKTTEGAVIIDKEVKSENVTTTTGVPFSIFDVFGSKSRKKSSRRDIIPPRTPSPKVKTNSKTDNYIKDDYYYDYYENQDSVNKKQEETPETNTKDPFAFIIPPNIKRKSGSSRYSNGFNRYEQSGSQRVETKSSRRAPLYSLLKNFSGMRKDPYEFSATENKENSINNKAFASKFDIKPAVLENYKSSTENSFETPTTEYNANSWYLIETRSKFPREKKRVPSRIVRKKNILSTDNLVSKLGAVTPSPIKYYTPTTEADGITANSLSELLQIFKYVTTPNPFDQNSVGTANEKRLRYTTEPPFTEKIYTTFRYTIPDSQFFEPTEPSINVIDELDIPSKELFNETDIVSNSLDGYVFADSIRDIEYRRPEYHPNRLHLPPKTPSKDLEIDDREKNIKNQGSQRGNIEETLLITVERPTTTTESPAPYHVHEGHSRVKVFGMNNIIKQSTNIKPNTNTYQTSTALNHIIMNPLKESPIIYINTTRNNPNVESEHLENFRDVPSQVHQNFGVNRIGEILNIHEKQHNPKLELDPLSGKEKNRKQKAIITPIRPFNFQKSDNDKKISNKANDQSFDLNRLNSYFRSTISEKEKQRISDANVNTNKRPNLFVNNSPNDPNKSVVEAILANPLNFFKTLQNLYQTQN